MERTHSSLELSKWLKEKRFCKKSKYTISGHNIINGAPTVYKYFERNNREDVLEFEYPAYDILNDLCVTHAKKLFGEEMLKWTELSENKKFYQQFKMPFFANEMCEFVPMIVMQLIKQGRKEEAEQYIMDNCIL